MNQVSQSLIKEILNRYIFASSFVSQSMVLDVACNEGYGSLYFARKGAKFVVGCDISKAFCHRAKKGPKHSNCDFVVCDAEKLPFKNDVFDVVVSLETIEHLNNYRSFLKRCAHVMKKSSTLILSSPNKKATSMLFKRPPNYKHVKEFYITELVSHLQVYFNDILVYGQEYTFTVIAVIMQLKQKFMTFAKQRLPKALLQLVIDFTNCMEHKELIDEMRARVSYKQSIEKFIEQFIDDDYSVTTFKDAKFRIPTYVVYVVKSLKK